MTITIQLSPETEARLTEWAMRSGKRPEQLALEALNDGLFTQPESTATLSTEDWLAEFDAWVSGHQSRNPNIDDSRDSFYPDRW